jgi:uncharacterized protein YqfB (UPF0267 family)
MSSVQQQEANWLEELVTKVKLIEQKWKLSTLKHYRECGKLILESQSERGKWSKGTLHRFIQMTGYKKSSIYYMMELGEMPDNQFSNILESYPSLYAWTARPKKLSLANALATDVPKDENKLRSLPFNCLIKEVLDGGKTMTSRNKSYGFEVGETVKLTCEYFALAEITGTDRKRLGDFSEEDAKLEGCKSLEEFKKVWIKLHGKWNPHKMVNVYKFKLKSERELL